MYQMMDAMEQYYIESNTQQTNTPDIDTPDIDTPDIDTPDIETPDIDIPGPIRVRSYRDNYIIHISRTRTLDIGDAVQALNLIAKRKCFDAIKSELKNIHGAALKSNINQKQCCTKIQCVKKINARFENNSITSMQQILSSTKEPVK